MKFITVRIEAGTIVYIEQEGDRYLSIKYKTGSGHLYNAKLDLSSDKFKWDKGALIYWHKDWPKDWILPGYAKQTRTARVYNRPEGDLIIESSFTEECLMLFVIPFRDYYETKLVLRAHDKAP